MQLHAPAHLQTYLIFRSQKSRDLGQLVKEWKQTENCGAGVRDTLFLGGGGGGRHSLILLERSQALPVRPSDEDRIKVKLSGR
jgi:hypothetical protein